jgi:hypothetical protein
LPEDLTPRKVADKVGWDEEIEVINVLTQKVENWKLREWVLYYETHPSEREGVYNVLYVI